MPDASDLRGIPSAKLTKLVTGPYLGKETPGDIPIWLRPPEKLKAAQKKLWNDAILSRGIAWFEPADVQLLHRLMAVVSIVALAEKACQENQTSVTINNYTVALANFDKVLKALAVRVCDRVNEAKRNRTAVPEGARITDLAARARENALDPLLQGLRIPDLRRDE